MEFWETYEYRELFEGLESANLFLRELNDVKDESNTSEMDTISEVAIVSDNATKEKKEKIVCFLI